MAERFSLRRQPEERQQQLNWQGKCDMLVRILAAVSSARYRLNQRSSVSFLLQTKPGRAKGSRLYQLTADMSPAVTFFRIRI